MPIERHSQAYRDEIARALGGSSEDITFGERLTIYLPNKGKDFRNPENREQVYIANWNWWIEETMRVLAAANLGVTALATSDALFIEDEVETWEETVVVYSFIRNRDTFRSHLPIIRGHLHAFGRDTGQKMVFLEFDGVAYGIKEYDSKHTA